MQTGTMHSKAHPSSLEGTFDRIDSPQYLNFNDHIPEAKDSYFERKEEDRPAKQPNAKQMQILPIDFEDEVIHDKSNKKSKDEDEDSIEENNNTSDDIIAAIQPLRVEETHAVIKPHEIITSTPFRVKGVEPMAWKPIPKPEIRNHTKPRPFSFEERNRQILQRKAHREQMILQAEKEARKFRANPVPEFLKKSCDTLNSEKKSKSTETLQSLLPTRFKAKSPKVLRRPAFQPNLPRQPLLLTQPFVLHSELRAKERRAFDNLIKEKERLEESLKNLKEAAQKRREEEEIVKMRKQRVIKAQPIRKFKSVTQPTAKRPLTEPITPKVIKRQRR